MPINLALEDLEALDFDEWEDLELPETHFDWSLPVSESPDERERRLADTARELWAVAVHWTRAKGPVCDFQLRGYGSAEDILFEDGKRCNLSGEQSRYDDTERERQPVDEAVRAMISDERAAWLQMDRVKDGMLSRLTEDREKLFGHLDRVTRAAPELIENARDVLERAIDFQQRHFTDYMSRATGQRESRVEAFKEYQKTKRMDAALASIKDMASATAAALPTLHFRRGQGAKTPLWWTHCKFWRHRPRRKGQARWREGLHHGLLGSPRGWCRWSGMRQRQGPRGGRRCRKLWRRGSGGAVIGSAGAERTSAIIHSVVCLLVTDRFSKT